MAATMVVTLKSQGICLLQRVLHLANLSCRGQE